MNRIIMVALITLFVLSIGLSAWMLVSRKESYVIARICADGSRVIKLDDGTYRTGGGYKIEDINTICGQK
jgi:hypothetical protein